MATYLVTGSSRGLGLELVRQIALLPPTKVTRIFAAARSDSSSELQEIVNQSDGRVVMLTLDTTKQATIDTAYHQVTQILEESGGLGLDILINNAGIMPMNPQGIETMDSLTETLDTNVTGAHRVISTFLPLLRKGVQKKVINL
ncbi:MAG: hypothetical protein Q9219_007456 [cf. Caloplaca sp. 3 TL-2023]